MLSRNISPPDREHMARVKAQPCSVCDAPAPSEAHHTKQGNHRTVIALCKDCHTGSRNGWHGQRLMWKLKKMDENDALNVTLRRLG